MASQEVSIKQNVSIILKSDTKVLGEVMVVAYGTAKKESFTGSASVINNGRFYKFNLSLANSQNLIKATANVILLSQI